LTLGYTLNRLLTEQAPVERDVGELDDFGGEAKADRQVIGTVRCRVWWWREAGSRSPSREYATPERTIHFTGGGVLLEPGADVLPGDHLANIEDEDGNVIVHGPFRVVSFEIVEDHLEAALMRP
jgi:hypothetical protein